MAVPATNTDPWSFDEARRFLRAFEPQPPPSALHLDSVRLPSTVLNLDPSEFNPKSSTPKALGDFDRLYAFCGIPVSSHPRNRHDTAESSFPSCPSLDLYSTSPSSAPDNIPDGADASRRAKADRRPLDDGERFDGFISKAKEVHWKDEVPGQDISESLIRSARVSIGDIDFAQLKRLLENDSDIEPSLGLKHAAKSQRAIKAASKNTHRVTLGIAALQKSRDSNLSWPPPPRSSAPPTYFDSRYIQPLLLQTITEKRARLVKKLWHKNLLSQNVKPMGAISCFEGYADVEGIHVFVDLSNIVIGFYDKLKADRRISRASYVKPAPFSYHSLSFILERSRGVARRVLAGSHGGLLHGQKHRWPDYMIEAEKCGYEMNILEPVYKAKLPTPLKRRNGTGNGYATTSGYSSGSDVTPLATPVRAEQCVDEILQMKMLESLVDTAKPSTMVLASGDAAEAEYSGGFLKMVERVLQKGWKVELLAWSSGLSMEYRSKLFLNKWGGRFRIIELDDFSEELLAVYTSSDPVEGAL